MAMDQVIKPDEQQYISDLVSFKDFKEKALSARESFRRAVELPEARQFVYPDDIPEKPPHLGSQLGDLIGTPAERDDEGWIRGMVKLGIPLDEANTSINSLREVEELAKLNRRDVLFRRSADVPDLPEVTELETLKMRAKVLAKFKPLKRPYRRVGNSKEDIELDQERVRLQNIMYSVTNKLKYTDYHENDLCRTRISEKIVDPAVVNDMVVTLTICKPYNHVPHPYEMRVFRVKPYWRFLLRGGTTMIEMHSLFKCSADYGTTVDAAEQVPQITDLNMFKYPSSFMFIHDTFYMPEQFYVSQQTLAQLDTTKMTPLSDISAPIRKWMEKKKKQFGPTKTKELDGVKVEDLECRLGYPYVYVHQGNCEHVFYFTDLRLMDAQDYPLSFPQLLADTSVEHYCKICHRHLAEWIVEGEEMPADPVHMCEQCFKSYRYAYQHRRDLKSTAHAYMDPSCLQL